MNLLVKAAHNGAAIYTGASVLWLEQDPGDDGWIVFAVPTDRALRTRHGEPLRIHASKVILAAGTFGSTEILMRSQSETLKFSERLGKKFSTNGDMIAVVYGHQKAANAIANEAKAPETRNIGPTITSMIDWRQYPSSEFAVQELAIPGPLRRFFEETTATAGVLDALGVTDHADHDPDDPGIDPCAVNPDVMHRSSIIASHSAPPGIPSSRHRTSTGWRARGCASRMAVSPPRSAA